MHPAPKTPSFQEHVTALRPFLYELALTWTRCHFDADDLVQETLIKALSSEEKYTEKGYLRAWLCTILRNKFIDQVRRDRSKHLKDVSEFSEVFSVPPDAPSALACQEVRRALSGLGGATAEVMLLRADEYKFEEIAQKLGLGLSNVKVKAHGAYKRLKVNELLGR